MNRKNLVTRVTCFLHGTLQFTSKVTHVASMYAGHEKQQREAENDPGEDQPIHEYVPVGWFELLGVEGGELAVPQRREEPLARLHRRPVLINCLSAHRHL